MKKIFVFVIFLVCFIIIFLDKVIINKNEIKEEYLFGKIIVFVFEENLDEDSIVKL